MQALAGFCLMLFVLTVTLVGARMLLLARRTRGRHELLMGAGMVLIGALGYPATIASGFGRSVGEMSVPLWFAGTFVTQLGLMGIYAFTWQVFRPGEVWGRAIVAIGSSIMCAALVGATHALATAPPTASSQLVTRSAMSIGMVGYCGCFLWSAVEGFGQYRKARRRLVLGLVDAVVANRFLLWGCFGSMATGINIASAVGIALGVDPSQSPLVLVPMGVLGFVASAAMYLAFLPPAAYLERVRARTAAP